MRTLLALTLLLSTTAQGGGRRFTGQLSLSVGSWPLTSPLVSLHSPYLNPYLPYPPVYWYAVPSPVYLPAPPPAPPTVVYVEREPIREPVPQVIVVQPPPEPAVQPG